jgi:hypothetical protein
METKKPHLNPQDFFLHLLLVVTLFSSITSLIAIAFGVINIHIADSLQTYYEPSIAKDNIKTALSFLIVSMPVYFFVNFLLNKNFIKNPEQRELTLRKWLLYFILFVASVTTIVDVVILVNHLLDGELTLRFVLKVLSVLILITPPSVYYLIELRKK